MTLQEQITTQLKEAMVARDAEKLSTVRMLKSALGYLQIERKTEKLDDASVIAVVQKEIKKRKDAISQYESASRPELAARERQEVTVLETFLPQAMSETELDALVKATIAELGATGKKDMGPVIKAVQTKAAGRAEGKTISAIVGKLLP